MKVKLGTKVKTLVDWSGVPKGSVGYIVEDYGTGFTVAWDLDEKPYPHELSFEEVAKMYAVNYKCPLRDGFDKDKEMQYLEVVNE